MDLHVEKEDGRLVVSTEERNHTLMNLLRQAVWDEGGEAGYDKGHPYAGETKLVVRADDPEAVLKQAVDHVRDELSAFEDAFDGA